MVRGVCNSDCYPLVFWEILSWQVIKEDQGNVFLMLLPRQIKDERLLCCGAANETCMSAAWYQFYKYSETWELGTPTGLWKTVLNSEVVLFLRSNSVYWIGLGTGVAALNSQGVPISPMDRFHCNIFWLSALCPYAHRAYCTVCVIRELLRHDYISLLIFSRTPSPLVDKFVYQILVSSISYCSHRKNVTS